jgi:hypothetical protein
MCCEATDGKTSQQLGQTGSSSIETLTVRVCMIDGSIMKGNGSCELKNITRHAKIARIALYAMHRRLNCR